jgi:predicted cobalt transporter CbtA
MKKQLRNSNKSTEDSQSKFVLEKQNYILLAIGFAIILLGFILMSGGKAEDPSVFNSEIFSFRRITLAPILLMFGFVVEIFAIMWRPKNKDQ